MPKIIVSVKIQKPKEEVYQLIKNFEDFPNFMQDVKSLKVIKRLSDNKILTAWNIEVDGAPIDWTEEDYFDEANFRIEFSMNEGSYNEYQGFWLLQGLHNATKLTLEANFDWGIPVLEKFIGKTLEDKARRSLLGMAQAIKKKAEKNYG